MPFNSTKTGLNPNHEVFDPLLNRVASVAAPYKRQTYGALPDWMLEVYGANEPRSEGQRKSLITISKWNSKTNSARFSEKPGKSVRGRRTRDYPERDRLKGIVKTHRALRIRDEWFLHEYEGPAYRNFFDNHYYSGSADDYLQSQSEYARRTPEEVSGPSLDDWAQFSSISDDEHPLVVDIKIVVKFGFEHLNGRLDKSGLIEEWAIPRYDEELRRLTSGSLEGVAVWEDPRDVPMGEFIGATVELPGGNTRSAFPDKSYILDPEALQTALESSGLLSEPTESTDQEADTESDGELSEGGQAEETDDTSSEESSQENVVQQRTLNYSNSPKERSSVFESSSESPEGGSGTQGESDASQQTTEGTAIIVAGDRYVVDDDDFDAVIDLLGLEDEPTPKAFFDAILTQLEEGKEAQARLEEIRERIGPMLDE